MNMALAITSRSIPHTNNNVVAAGKADRHGRLLQCLRQCTSMSQLKQIHAQTIRAAPPDDPETLFVYSRIFQFAAFKDLDYAFRVFDEIEEPNSFTWNTLIRACAHSKHRKEAAISLYKQMLNEHNAMPDNHTFPFVLKACGYLFSLSEGKQVHAQALKHGFDSDVYVNNSLIHLYSTCGCLEFARKVFDKMTDRSLVSWNVMIEGFVQLGEFNDALTLFSQMQTLFEPDGYTMESVISACAGVGALSMGIWAHAYILRNCDSNVANNIVVNNSLIEMYCKCGSLKFARQVFNQMHKRDVNSLNKIILGSSAHGQSELALHYFDRMVNEEGIIPNSITFVGILSACNHNGLITEGRKYFQTMIKKYNINPVLEHYGCLIDLLARAGLIDEALDLVSNMPMKPDAVIWRSLLDACCKKNMGLEFSEELAKQIIESEDSFSGSGVYMLLSRIYASADRWNEVGLIRKLMSDKGVVKQPGCSSIEIDGFAHEFFAGDTTHPRTKEIYRFLDFMGERLKLEGYVPDFSPAGSLVL